MIKALKLKNVGLEITLTTNAFMRVQNKKHMQKKDTTDVLSFPQLSPPRQKIGDPLFFSNKFLGDILVSLDQAKKQAKENNRTLRQEIVFLILHSLLHLTGYDHYTKPEQKKMQAIENKIFKVTG